jgi:hypothetical protein
VNELKFSHGVRLCKMDQETVLVLTQASEGGNIMEENRSVNQIQF